MNIVKHTTLSAIFTAITLSAAIAEAQPYDYRLYSPNIEVTKKYQLDKRTNIDIDNSKRSWVKKNYNWNYRQDNLNANQNQFQKRKYSSAVSQGAANVGGDVGHKMKQNQGGTSVNTGSRDVRNHRHSGFNIGSPSATNNSGATTKGNISMFGSQIGANQSGFQGGNNTNVQANDQMQYGKSTTGSLDYLSNGNRK